MNSISHQNRVIHAFVLLLLGAALPVGIALAATGPAKWPALWGVVFAVAGLYLSRDRSW